MKLDEIILIEDLVSSYAGIDDAVKWDIESRLEHGEHPSLILSRFVNGCMSTRITGSESCTVDPEYRRIITGLVNAGADVNVGKGRYSPIHDATAKGDVETVRLLIEQGADLNSKAEYPDQAIHFAAHNGHLDIICFLIKKGVDINAKGGDRNTALHYAVEGGRREAIEFLLLHGADPKAKNSVRISAYDMARTKKDNDIISIFGFQRHKRWNRVRRMDRIC